MKAHIYLCFILLACQSKQEFPLHSAEAVIIENARIIDVRQGSFSDPRQILIDSGKIVAIAADLGVVPPDVQRYDAAGKYLMPGLAEMHAHIPSPQPGRDYTEEILFLYLSNGITTIRGMLGHPDHLELRRKAAANEIVSPRIYTSSPSMNGNTVTTTDQARSLVEQYQADGYDFLKLHPGIQLEVFDTIVATAKRVGIPYAGHVSVHVGIRHALESDYASVDHVDGFLEGLVPASAGVDPTTNGFFGFNYTNLADTALIPGLVALAKQHEVWVVPTQSLFDRWFSPQDPEEMVEQPEMKYMPDRTLEAWVESKKQLIGDENYSTGQWEIFNAIRRKLIYQLQHNGHGLILGSDAPQVFNVPGFSIQHEIQGMLDAGLTPAEIIRMGTLHPAIYFGEEGNFGEVVPGASADLILVENNPLEDLSTLQTPVGVWYRGNHLDGMNIDRRLAEIAENINKNTLGE